MQSQKISAMRMFKLPIGLLLIQILLLSNYQTPGNKSPHRLEILFLGHNSEHHSSSLPAELLSRELFAEGINTTYTEQITDLNKDNLKNYDGLVLYANYDSITNEQATALLDFVHEGKAFIPIHCASYCFRNNDAVVDLIGGQFLSHHLDSFAMTIVQPNHPAIKGLTAFSTFDETYVHDKFSKEITVLTERVEGQHHEPYTWVRNYGKGRVFYTAYGHDERTWKNPGFLHLLKNGVLWALGDEAAKKLQQLNLPTLSFTPANIPNYEKVSPPPQLQAPLSPEQSMQLTQLPIGFEMKLFAAEPDVVKPIYMDWDERGRLWVIETVDYPNSVKENKNEGNDRIKILEDTDGDGKADKFTIFADKLNLPTSFTFANGGIIVSQAPYFLFLKDTNGDDKADKRDTLITGWGTFDTHAGPSNLRYGFDNKIWGVVGYSGFKGLAGKKDTLTFSQGIYQLNPDGKNLQYLGKTSNNTWGLGFSEEFDVFTSTANNTHSAFYGIPKSDLDRVSGIPEPGIKKIDGHYAMHSVTQQLRQVDVQGGFTAAAGHGLYTARSFPQQYWNRVAFVCEPTGRVIHNAIMEKDGAGFKEKDGWNLLASSDNWFGPVQAQVGPDGAVWVADWYNFIIQHNPTPVGFENGKGNAYINPLRDKTRGRVYRIVYTGSKTGDIKSLDKNNLPQLINALSNDNLFWRMTAQRLLVESGNTTVLPALYELINNKELDIIGLNAPAIHALWTLHGLKALDGKNKTAIAIATAALKHPAAGVRKAAINVLPATASIAQALVSAGVFKDPDLRVRLAAVLKSASLPAVNILGSQLFEMLKDEKNSHDYWISKAIFIASAKQQQGFMEAYTALSKTDKNRLQHDSLLQRILLRGTLKGNSKILSANKSVAMGKADKVIVIRTIKNAMKYDKPLIRVKAGTVVQIRFENIDFMQHNLLILKPGSLEKVGAATDIMAQDAKNLNANYIPKMPEVLFYTPLINPDGKFILKFKVPSTKGKYPFICSFPGHWRIMQGVMEVE